MPLASSEPTLTCASPLAESLEVTRRPRRRTSGALRRRPRAALARSDPSLTQLPLSRLHSQSYLFAACVAAIIAGSLAKLTNRYKWFGVLGVLIHMVGVWLMMRSRDLKSSTFELVMSQVVGGVGGGFTTIAVQIGCQGVVEHQGASALSLSLARLPRRSLGSSY